MAILAILDCLLRGHAPRKVGVPDDWDWQCVRCGRLVSAPTGPGGR